jgi:uncharacterized protein (TIRG00374 family)
MINVVPYVKKPKFNRQLFTRGASIALLFFGVLTISYQAWFFSNNREVLASIRLDFLFAAILSELLAISTLILPYQKYFKRQGITMSFWQSLVESLAGLGVGKIVILGDLLVWRRVMRQEKRSVMLAGKFMIVLYSLAIGTLAAMFLIAVVISTVFYGLPGDNPVSKMIGLVPIVFAVVIIGIFLSRNSKFVHNKMEKFSERFVGETSLAPWQLVKKAGYLRRDIFQFAFSLSASWFFEGVALWFILQAFDLKVSFLVGIYGYLFSRLAVFLPIIPGGVGESETITASFFVSYGHPLSTILAAVLAFRILSFWFPAIIGLGMSAKLFLPHRHKKK